MKSSILRAALLGIICLGVPVESKNNVKTVSQYANNIVFNSWYHSGKEKWRGPYHNNMLYTWFTTTTSAKNLQEYRKLINKQRENGVKFIGYAYSSTTSAPPRPIGHSKHFPESAIPPEAIEYSWIVRDAKGGLVTWKEQKNRYFLDVGKKEVQDAVLVRAIGNAKSLGCNVLFLDNWYYKYWSPPDMSRVEWTQKCMAHLKRARELTIQNNLKLVVNTPTPPKYWPEFAAHLDGISYELPAHPSRLVSRGRYELELSGYEKVIAMGKSIFLYTDRLTHNGERWDKDGRKVAATAMLVISQNQPYWGGIYIANPRYEVFPVGGWALWPEQLGKPLGPRQWNGNTITRNFERGSISVTVGEVPKFNVSLRY